jgi:UDP-GlcNAc3NAcA epimerase
MKILHVVGARPQFIKMAVVCRAIARHNEHGGCPFIQEEIIHTGQHYDRALSEVFFAELAPPRPKYNLQIGSGSHGEQTGMMLREIERVLMTELPDVVLVYGDTNSTLAGALAAAKLHITVAHVEAGLRSYNRMMPEEVNRRLTDHVSDILLCPTRKAVEMLEAEGFTCIANQGDLVDGEAGLSHDKQSPWVVNVGDVMYDSVLSNVERAIPHSTILQRTNVEEDAYFLATVHRAENTDDESSLAAIFSALSDLGGKDCPVVLPLHPRTRKALGEHRLADLAEHIAIIEPVSYLDMLVLERGARAILTDSGGVQKEAFILRRPCVTMREETEWPETVELGWNILAGHDPAAILGAVDSLLDGSLPVVDVDPFGDGAAGERIVRIIAA